MLHLCHTTCILFATTCHIEILYVLTTKQVYKLHSSDVIDAFKPSYESGREAPKVLLSLEIPKWWSPGPSHASNQKGVSKTNRFLAIQKNRLFFFQYIIDKYSNPGINHLL